VGLAKRKADEIRNIGDARGETSFVSSIHLNSPTLGETHEEHKKTHCSFQRHLAIQIRKLLDDARAAYGPNEWDEDEVENAVIELVCEE
jgi:hypothetical protein